MALGWQYDAHSEIGLVRTTNQDSAYASADMLMVADGMGGAAAGDLASAVATWELRRTDQELAAHLEAGGDLLELMHEALARANARIVELVDEDPELSGMGTTVCGFVRDGDRVAVVNIGDSRAYLVRGDTMRRVTRDHSWVQTLVDEGRISEEEALEHPHRSLVLKVLNGSPQHEPDLGWLDVQPGDRLLVCSDGLCGLVTDAEIAPLVTAGKPRPETIADLVSIAHAAGGHDNITIVLADVDTDGAAAPTPRVLGAAESTPNPTPEQTLAFTPLAVDQLPPDVAHERAMTEEERYALLGRRRRRAGMRLVLLTLIPVLALVGGVGVWYQYTQSLYFIGTANGNVALYRGVPDRVLGLPLSTMLSKDSTSLGDLPPYYREMVTATITVRDLATAESTLDELRLKAEQCIAQREARARATAAPTPQPTQTPAPLWPEPTPGATASATAVIEPAPTSPPPVTSPEEC